MCCLVSMPPVCGLCLSSVIPPDGCGIKLLLLLNCCVVEVVHCHFTFLCVASFQSASVANVHSLLAFVLALSFSFVVLLLLLCLPSFAAVSISLSNRSFALVLSFAHSFVSFSMSFAGLTFVAIALCFTASFPLVAFAFVNGSYVHCCHSSVVDRAHARAWRLCCLHPAKCSVMVSQSAVYV